LSLALLVSDHADDLVRNWPAEPRLYRRGVTDLDRSVPLGLLDDHIDFGLLSPAYVAAVRDGQAVHPGRFSADGRMKPGALRALATEGYTINLRHLHDRVPFLAALCRGIEQQTGHPAYVSGIITPPGGTGLRHHWDQFTAIVTQLAGRKRWPVWAPVVENPTGDHLSSPQVWTPELQHRLENTPPDLQYDLEPGDTLVLPRGWIHSPRSVPTSTETSYHLTFAVQERTWLWAMQQLLAPLIEDPAARAGIPPTALVGNPEEAARTARTRLLTALGQQDPGKTNPHLRRAALRLS
jgi:hypothetical protein